MSYPNYTTWIEPFLEGLRVGAQKPRCAGRHEVYKRGAHWAVSVPGMEWAHPYTFDTWGAAYRFAHRSAGKVAA